MCDETFSVNYVADVPAGVDRGWFMFFVTLLDQFYWVTGATLGGLCGSLITFNTKGLDFVMTALFAVSALLGKRKTPEYITYFGKALSAAIFGMLVVYCLKSVDIAGGNHGLPELISLAVLTAIHLWRKNMLLSIAAGTVCYMLLVQFVFV